MRVRKFEGATMRDAIAKVKAELGDQAVIISSRQVRRGLLGSAVEIAAAIDTDEPEPARPLDGPLRANTPAGGPAQAKEQAQKTEQEVEKQLAPLRSELRSLRALVRTSGESRNTVELRAELQTLRKLVEELRPLAHSSQAAHAEPSAPRRGAAAYDSGPRTGYAAGTSAPLAHAAVAAGAAGISPRARRAPVSSAPPSNDAPLTAASTARVVMLVGPTGAGKTTTIAKLAARAALIDRRQVGVITLDNYRVGGIDQIRTFTDLIGVPLQVSDGPAQLESCIHPDHDLTLIDTAGRSPRDRAAIDELASHIDGLDIEVHLVVPAGASAAQIDELIQRYSPLAPARLLFTKLDEYRHAPEVALAPARTRIPITWVTTGQAVPEDIEQPSSARVLELATTGLSDPPRADTPTPPVSAGASSAHRTRSHRAA